jgi:hypothetical protein
VGEIGIPVGSKAILVLKWFLGYCKLGFGKSGAVGFGQDPALEVESALADYDLGREVF